MGYNDNLQYGLRQIRMEDLSVEIFTQRPRWAKVQAQLKILWNQDVFRYSDGIQLMLLNVIDQRVSGDLLESVWD